MRRGPEAAVDPLVIAKLLGRELARPQAVSGEAGCKGNLCEAEALDMGPFTVRAGFGGQEGS